MSFHLFLSSFISFIGVLIVFSIQVFHLLSFKFIPKYFFLTLNFFFNFLFIYLFLAVLGLRFCARAFSSCGKWGGHSSLRCTGLSVSRPLLLRSTGSRRAGSAAVAHGPSCSAACGILPAQGSNPCPLHWQADSQPLHHQGSPYFFFFGANVNGIVFYSVSSLLVYRNTTDFCMLILYPETTEFVY